MEKNNVHERKVGQVLRKNTLILLYCCVNI